MDIAANLSDTLKTLRQARGWSLTQAAEQTGVSKAMLGQIERQESSPTVATLWKIATGFNVPFSVFIASAQTQQKLIYAAPQGLTAEPLFPFDPVLGLDFLVVTLAPGGQSESSAHEAGTIEHVVVIQGELQLQTDGEWRTLTPGEGHRFIADRTHAYRNPTSAPTRFHSLIHYPRHDNP